MFTIEYFLGVVTIWCIVYTIWLIVGTVRMGKLNIKTEELYREIKELGRVRSIDIERIEHRIETEVEMVTRNREEGEFEIRREIDSRIDKVLSKIN